MFDTQSSQSPVIFEIDPPVILKRNTTVTVPMHKQSFIAVGQRVICRVPTCTNLNVHKEYQGAIKLGQEFRLIHVVTETDSFRMGWGVGKIQVNNERLKAMYDVGARGTFSVKLEKPLLLVRNFLESDTELSKEVRKSGRATLEDVRSLVSHLFRSSGRECLAKFFANTNISIFEIHAHLSEYRDNLFDALKGKNDFNNYGLKLTSLNVEAIHINEQDLERIRDIIENQ